MFAELNKSICKVCKCNYKQEDRIKALEHEILFVYHGI